MQLTTIFKNSFILCTLLLGNIANAADQPNIIFILGDDINRDSIACYGSADGVTPNIDRLATEGVRFDRAYTSVAMCAPFRQELYSGKTPWNTRAFMNHSHTVPGNKSIPIYMQELGYNVGLVGKSHVGPKSIYPFDYTKAGDSNEKRMKGAKDYIQRSVAEKKPFCLFIASNDAHAPFTSGDTTQYNANKLTVPPYWIDTPTMRQQMVKYLAEVTNFDALVGRVDRFLKQNSLQNNTILMVCTEQGSQLPFAKWTCYDNGLHTGLVVRWPGVSKPGHVCDELVWMPDIAPTLIAAGGGNSIDKGFDGFDIRPLIEGNAVANNEFVFGAFTNKGINGNRERIYPIRSVRNKRFSLIYQPNYNEQTSNVTLDALRLFKADKKSTKSKGEDVVLSWHRKQPEDRLIRNLYHRPQYELYDLTMDPYELNNVADNPEYKQHVTDLRAELEQHLAKHGDSDSIATENELTTNKRGRK